MNESRPPRDTGDRLATLPRSDPKGDESELRVSLDAFNGNPFVSLRVWTQDPRSGQWWPTKRGCSIRLSEADDVREALAQAVRLVDARRDRQSRPRAKIQRAKQFRHNAQFNEFD